MEQKPIFYIRKGVFGMSQSEFAAMLGITQPVVSDMERTGSVSLRHQKTIRDEAAARNIEWSDSWFFEPAAFPSREPAQ